MIWHVSGIEWGSFLLVAYAKRSEDGKMWAFPEVGLSVDQHGKVQVAFRFLFSLCTDSGDGSKPRLPTQR